MVIKKSIKESAWDAKKTCYYKQLKTRGSNLNYKNIYHIKNF